MSSPRPAARRPGAHDAHGLGAPLRRSDAAHDRALTRLGATITTVAHEMRNLLGGVEMYATLMAEQCADDHVAAPLAGRLLSSVTRLRALAANLLAVGRRSTVAADLAPVDLARIVTEVVEGAVLATSGTDVEIVICTAVPKAPVLGDGERLRQALLNLVLNALQAMDGGGTLTVGTRRVGGRVEVTVRDSGVGMDRATLARAFEPFFTTRPAGTGLGLAVVRDVAAAHGARLSLLSRPGHGTTARMTFTLLDEHGAHR